MLKHNKLSILMLILLLAGSCIIKFNNAADAKGDEHEEDTDFKDNSGGSGGDDHHEDSGDTKHKPDDPDISTSKEHFDKDGHHDDEYDHEAVTGSQAEAENFKELAPEEAKRRLALLVDKMDTDKDAKINREELTKWIINSFEKLDIENSKHKFEEHDENDDKKVTWGEYMHKSYGYKPTEMPELEKDKNPDMVSFIVMLKQEKKKFDLADQNKDGFLDDKEYVAFAHPQNYPHMAPYEVERSLHDFDKDKDGMISFLEFAGIGKNDTVPGKDSLKEEQTNFDKYDLNKDGKLDRNEIVPWAMPGFRDSAKAEVDHLFKETDKDKDSKLSKDEIVNQHELWVGSHATDYGKHLDDLKKSEL